MLKKGRNGDSICTTIYGTVLTNYIGNGNISIFYFETIECYGLRRYTCNIQKVNFKNTLYICIITTGGFPGGSDGKESACNAGDLGSIPGLGRSPGEGKGYPLQYSGLENSTDCIVHGVTKSQTRLNDFPSYTL